MSGNDAGQVPAAGPEGGNPATALVADIAHQLRTPVSVLQAGSEAMLDGVTGLTSRNVESLREESIRLGKMVDDLQQLSAAESAAVQLALTPCNLDAAVAASADALGDIFDQAGVRLLRQLDPVTARCDQRRMHDIITNLLTNAAKYTPHGGTVTLETRTAGPDAIVRVSDTGIGIPREELPHITGRFYRGTNSAQVSGSGIGLAIVDELVRGHHGTMDVISEEGQGTEVTITIPRT